MNATTISKTTPNLRVDVNTLPTFGELKHYLDVLVSYINKLLEMVMPNYTIWLVFVIAVIAGMLTMKNLKREIGFGIIMSILVFGFLRWLGIGG